MTISKEILDITLILLPGIVSYLIAEALIPHKKAEFNRSVIYVITLSTMSFLISLSIFKLYYYLSVKLKFATKTTGMDLGNNIFSFHSNFEFTILVFVISISMGLFFAWAINKNLIYKLMNKLGGSNMTSNMEVWDDFFLISREDSIVVVRDINKDLMYYGTVNYYSIGTTSKMIAIHLTDVDVFNSSSEKLYNVFELYLPFNAESMTIEFPNFDNNTQGE